MLSVFIKDSNEKLNGEVVTDVEKEFSKIRLTGKRIEKILIEKIEKGKYNDANSYIDRFGYKLYYSDMSNGCKAALCVVNLPDKIIDLAECGNNARDIIISFCKTGNILIEDNGLTISAQYNNDIDVKIDKYRFSDIDRLNKYISDERLYGPDMSIGGIERCI